MYLYNSLFLLKNTLPLQMSKNHMLIFHNKLNPIFLYLPNHIQTSYLAKILSEMYKMYLICVFFLLFSKISVKVY